MSSEEKDIIQLLQGTLDLIVLRTLASMGPQHAYQIATRLQQVSDRLLNLNQGTLYPALVRLEQYFREKFGVPTAARAFFSCTFSDGAQRRLQVCALEYLTNRFPVGAI
jgi:hypothetical protein